MNEFNGNSINKRVLNTFNASLKHGTRYWHQNMIINLY